MISLVIPCYNETEVLRLTYETVVREADGWNEPYEILLIDDGSADDTWQIIEALGQRDSRVRGLRLSRNFGHQAAMGAGLEAARGEAVVVLDADLQDPPSLVRLMLAKWREGFEVVYAQRQRREGESLFKRATANAYYRILDWMTTIAIPRNTGDFCLFDAKVVRELVALKEHALFWRGLRKWTGFRQTAVVFDRPQRRLGTTKYSLRKMLRLASDGIFSFSQAPLRFAFYAAFASFLLSTALTLGGLGAWLFNGSGWPIPWGALATFYLGSIQLFCLGILGEYLARIYDEVRARPRWIIAGRVNELAAGQEPARPRQAA
ncbi:MAG TPA: glycosyltransferase family 2 protein [Pirellulales bacterium]|jgi:dolichol-phosphate mannosyltransferase|nr:glycosyltransferase family 2 protein [Pirellulales bacterium]